VFDGWFVHDDVKDVFDQLPEDKDVVMTVNRPYNAKVVYHVAENAEQEGAPARELRHWKEKDMKLVKEGKAHMFRWHCGFFVWRKNQLTTELWDKWIKTYKLHNDTKDGHRPYVKSMKFWDTFAFWRVLHENPHLNDIVGQMDSQRWNYVHGYREKEELEEGKEMVFYHYSRGEEARKEGLIRESNIPLENGTWRVVCYFHVLILPCGLLLLYYNDRRPFLFLLLVLPSLDTHARSSISENPFGPQYHLSVDSHVVLSKKQRYPKTSSI
jgi:hypothetical protein